jgi:hypothetical protein
MVDFFAGIIGSKKRFKILSYPDVVPGTVYLIIAHLVEAKSRAKGSSGGIPLPGTMNNACCAVVKF